MLSLRIVQRAWEMYEGKSAYRYTCPFIEDAALSLDMGISAGQAAVRDWSLFWAGPVGQRGAKDDYWMERIDDALSYGDARRFRERMFQAYIAGDTEEEEKLRQRIRGTVDVSEQWIDGLCPRRYG
jgi:hypothetical protein